jgi:transmembrane sensor
MRNDDVDRDESTDPSEHWCDSIKSDPVYSEAARWLARLSRPENMVADSDVAEFREWRDRDLRHASAFVRLVTISHKLSNVGVRSPSDLGKLMKGANDGTVGTGNGFGVRYRRRAYAAAASIAIAMFIVAALVYDNYKPLARASNDVEEAFETSVGENRSVDLIDGSRVTLGGHTRVSVVLTGQVRSVKLERGEAYFEVAKDPARNFVVHAGGIAVTAVGTRFNVHRAEKAIVTVTEGRVFVESSGRVERQMRRVYLNAGEQSTASEEGIGAAVRVTDVAPILSWQSGRLSFRQLPLRDAVRDVNRYSLKPLVFESPGIGDIVVTGTVMTSNVAGWTKSLERAFDLTATELPDRIEIRTNQTPGPP